MADSSVGEPGRACEALLSRRWVAPLNAHAVVYNARARSHYIKLVKARHQRGVRACVPGSIASFVLRARRRSILLSLSSCAVSADRLSGATMHCKDHQV